MAKASDKPMSETVEVVQDAAPAATEVAPETDAAEAAQGDAAEPAATDAPVPADGSDADEAYDDEPETDDSLTYSNGVIEKIVAMATREVPHVLGMKGNIVHFFQEQLGAENLTKGVTVEVTDDNRMIINISVIIEYGCYAPDIFEDVKERVTARLDEMTGLEVAGINLRIEDVLTREEYEASRKKLIDNLKHDDADEA
ncbi:Asp23/Gls24 family envelope stress response protein [[Collinsella] massiliensis]|uniref:Asp23/Gls24 family envelope stress response protein n=1 Tax=[Collinsella] massiliensis TaxID=1232426 RepID=A0A1Y3XR59_9ACTN|nr:Asp23/Gls24 family envelope stress response protein [[Collinsella] massiliensis]OUN87541.1 Asp23/Gls24 family envelope stress response protein [[Collinsella] massiliensis]